MSINTGSLYKWTSISSAGRTILQIIQISILARILVKSDFGLLAISLLVINFSNMFVDAGITSSIFHVRKINIFQFSTIYWFTIFLAVVVYTLVIALSPVVSEFYKEKELLKLLPLLGLNLIFLAIGKLYKTIKQKQLEFDKIAKIELSMSVITVLSSIVFALNDYKVYSLIYSTLLGSLFSSLIFLYIGFKGNPIKPYFKFSLLSPFFKIGIYNLGSNILEFISREMDVIVVGKMMNIQTLGIYSLCKQLSMKLYSIINPIVITVLNPVLAKLQSESIKFKRLVLRTIKTLAVLNAPIYIFIVILSQEILHILYGPEYTEGYIPYMLLSASYFIITIQNPSGSIQIAKGRTDLGLLLTFIKVVILPVVIIAVAPFGVNYICFSIALFNLLYLYPTWKLLLKKLATIRLREFLEQFIQPLLLMIIALIMVLLIEEISFLRLFSIEMILLKILICLIFAWFMLSRYNIVNSYFYRLILNKYIHTRLKITGFGKK